ncbi:MAG: DUF3667 domain-containing protein [Flavobacteriaceae bacterium]
MANIPAAQKKGRYGLQYRGVECTNCGHPLDISDRFCPNCSQANSTKKLSVKDYAEEFLGSLFSYDSKLLKTLSALLWRPGRITKDYIAGKRVSYTNPFRFLLSLAILYFLLISLTGNFKQLDRYGQKNDTEDPFDINIDVLGDDEDAITLKSNLDSISKSDDYKEYLQKTKKRDSVILANPKAHYKAIDTTTFFERIPNKREMFSLLIKEDTLYSSTDAFKKYDLAPSLENKVVYNAANGILALKKSPGQFLGTLVSRLPFTIFFFLPVFTLFVWLAYIRKKYSYTDHLVFSFHNQALLFILLIISFIIGSIFKIDTNSFFVSAFAVYLFLAMKRFYGQGIFKTFVKYLFLNTVFLFLTMFTMFILFLGGLITY